jgi:hypothetical protein
MSRIIFADDPERAERVALAIEFPAGRLDQLVFLATLHKSEPSGGPPARGAGEKAQGIQPPSRTSQK